MPYFDRSDVSKGIHVNKTSKSKKRDICHYCYFLNKGLKFQPYACNKCHDSLIMSMKLSVMIITLFLAEQGYNFLQNIELIKKSEHYKNF